MITDTTAAPPPISKAGTFKLGRLNVNRLGYGAMQLVGPGVFGPPKDREAAIAVLREAVRKGVNHIDTSDFYGPHVTNEIIREALHPYPNDLVIVTKVGARRGDDGSWIMDRGGDSLVRQVHDNLRNLWVEALDTVNMRVGGVHGPEEGPIAPHIEVLAKLQREGLIRHIGVSTVTPSQFEEARGVAEIVCVQNHYNLAHREDDAFIEQLAGLGVAYVPYFPLGGFTPLQSDTLNAVAARIGATPMQVALAWLRQRAANILLIPGTSSLAHLRENLAAADLELSAHIIAELDAIVAPSA
jgi:aryl-alcohol dehydrogenase-like predicted oxidoreductase